MLLLEEPPAPPPPDPPAPMKLDIWAKKGKRGKEGGRGVRVASDLARSWTEERKERGLGGRAKVRTLDWIKSFMTAAPAELATSDRTREGRRKKRTGRGFD